MRKSITRKRRRKDEIYKEVKMPKECPLNEAPGRVKRNCTEATCAWWVEAWEMCSVKAIAIKNLGSKKSEGG